MTNIDVNRSFEPRQAADGVVPAPARASGADELRGLLNVIADQISTADRRHSSVLTEMRDRLTVLSQDTRAVRGQVTGDLGPVFNRIEDALTQLADRIGDTHDEAAADRALMPSHAEIRDAGAAKAIPSLTHTQSSQGPGSSAPAVLRSASPSAQAEPQVFARAGEGRGPVQNQIVDTFDVVDASMPSGHAEPWDSEQAEALARVYEEDRAAEAGRDYETEPLARGPVSYASDPGFQSPHTGYMDAPMPRSSEGYVSEQPMRAMGAYHGSATQGMMPAHGGSLSAPAIERDWLESRFADIAERIERSLAAMSPESPAETLGQRFDDFERRFGEALHEVATRADVDGLRVIENQIGELTGHVEQAHQQLSRLDEIEHQISAVIEQIAKQHAQGEGAMPAAAMDPQDIERVAEMAAEQVAQRFAGQLGHTAGEGGSSEIRELLESFIAERRQGDEQTMSMLDTLQQALIRVLDRVDAIEVAQHSMQATQPSPAPLGHDPQGYGDAGTGYAAGYDQGAGHDYADPYARAYPGTAPGARSYGQQPSPFDDLRSDEIAPMAPMDEEQAAHDYDPAATFGDAMQGANAAAQGIGHDAAYLPQGQAYGGAPGYQPEPAAQQQQSFRPSIEKLRQDFIADAQRAKMKAAAQQQKAPDPDAVVLRTPAQPASGRSPVVGGAESAGTPSKKPLNLSARTLALALAAILAIGGAFLMLPKGTSEPVEAPAVTSTPEPAAKPAPKVQAEKPAAPVQGAPAASTPAPAAEPPSAAPKAPAPADAGTKVNPPPPADSNRNSLPQRRSDVPAASGAAAGAATADAHGGAMFSEPTADDEAAASGPDLVAASKGAIPGLHVQLSDQLPSAEDFSRIRQQQKAAKMSEQIAAKASEFMSPAAYLQGAPAAAPQAVTAEATPSSDGTSSQQASSHLDLPPATVGPLSLRLAAAKGDPSAQFEVGARLAEGKGTNQNFTEAMRWYSRSAAQGFAQSQYRLGTLYERGLGTKSDLAMARDWYQRAAEQGNVKAMHNLAVLSAGNNGTAGPDYQTASAWFTKAAERGLQDSQYNLGVLYESGLGVGKDTKTAYKWFALAARGGDKEAQRRRDAVYAELSQTDKAEADGMVKSFAPVTNDLLVNDARAAGEDWKKRQTTDDNT